MCYITSVLKMLRNVFFAPNWGKLENKTRLGCYLTCGEDTNIVFLTCYLHSLILSMYYFTCKTLTFFKILGLIVTCPFYKNASLYIYLQNIYECDMSTWSCNFTVSLFNKISFYVHLCLHTWKINVLEKTWIVL